ncbi:MAG TPA: MFS transporter [bacterium]|nr:MFS transporter [bacterium]
MNRRVLFQLSYGHFATDLSQGALPALLPLFKAQYHLSYTDVGIVVLMANISSSIVQPAFGVLSDRVRMRWLMPAGALISGTGMIFAVAAHHFAVMMVMIFVCGLGVAAFHPEGYRWAGLASGERRATGMSYFSAGGNVGYGFGPAAASIALHLAGLRGLLYMPVFSIPAAVILWLVGSPRRRSELEAEWHETARAIAPEEAGSRTSAVPADPPTFRRATMKSEPPAGRCARMSAPTLLGLLVTFVILRSWMSTGESSFIPLYFAGVHLTPTYAGLLVSVFLGAGSVGTLLGGMAADRWGRRRMLLVSMAILPPLLWLMPRAVGPLGLAAALIAGMAAVSTFAVVMVMAQSVIPGRIGLISGLIIGFAVGTGGIGTTLLGAIADRWGVLRALDVTALLPLAALAIALLLPPDSPGARNPDVETTRTSVRGAHASAAGGS